MVDIKHAPLGTDWPHAAPREGWRHPWCGSTCQWHAERAVIVDDSLPYDGEDQDGKPLVVHALEDRNTFWVSGELALALRSKSSILE